MEHIVIIGNGIAGITTARHIRKRSDKRITVISGESDYFFSRTALMYVYMGHMKWEHLKPYEDWFWEKNRIELKKAWVKTIDFDQKQLNFSSGESMSYDKLVLATGSVYNKFGWEGENLKGVQGVVSKQDLELLEKNTKNCRKAVIVGGGLIGCELAEMLTTRNIEVTFLVRESGFWGNVLPSADAKMISRHIESHGVKIKHNNHLVKVISNENEQVQAVVPSEGIEIECQLVGLCTGVRPNIDFLKNSELQTDRGILVNEYLETNIPDVYAIGDCIQLRNPKINRQATEAVWYTARMMGETLALSLTGNRTKYNPGIWFNSAKFFDIEYQTYGRVSAEPGEEEQHFRWEHKDGTKAITLAFNPFSNEFLGINSFGLRLRHEVTDRWLREKKSLAYVLSNLREANFDPEFHDRYEKEIFRSFKESLEGDFST